MVLSHTPIRPADNVYVKIEGCPWPHSLEYEGTVGKVISDSDTEEGVRTAFPETPEMTDSEVWVLIDRRKGWYFVEIPMVDDRAYIHGAWMERISKKEYFHSLLKQKGVNGE